MLDIIVTPNEINCLRNARTFGWRHQRLFAKPQIIIRLGKLITGKMKILIRDTEQSNKLTSRTSRLKQAVLAHKMAAWDEVDVVESWEEIEDTGVCYLY
jgi:hypothetical protein